MRYDDKYESNDIEDRRGAGGGSRGGFSLMPRLGWGGFLLVGLLSLIFRRNLFSLVSEPGRDAAPRAVGPRSSPDRKTDAFVGFVLDDIQTTWQRVLPSQGQTYERAKLVLFTDSTPSGGCGVGEAAMGPFYCPADRKVYLDLGFFQALQRRLGAPGDFAQAYVIAHEVGHHVQNLLGTEAKLRREQRGRPDEKNGLSVRMELQADCYAGVWAHSTDQRKLLEEGDVDEAMGAAAAVGDDRLQKQAGARVNPERWTHGSSAMRTRWFKTGLERGRPEDCDTFRAGTL